MTLKEHPNVRRQLLGNVRRVVVKVGASVLAELPVARVRALAADIALLRGGGVEVVIVSSGSIGMGMARLDLKRRPRQMPLLQAAAAVGQVELMGTYEDALHAHRIPTAQVLLTRGDLDSAERFLRLRHTLMSLLDYGVVPVINENDSVAVEEIIGSDNDMLAARVPRLVEADLLAMLTAAEGIYAASPRKGGEVIALVEDIDALAQRVSDGISRGRVQRSLASKVRAAATAASDGVPTLVASGIRPGALANMLDDETIGTLLLPGRVRRSRKQWIADDLAPKGILVVCAEAHRALLEGRRSLQAQGIERCEGEFAVGDAVRVADPAGAEFARGLVSYGSGDLARVRGKEPAEIEHILGFRHSDEVVRRDDLVTL
jgi:glutamate 5-kinase